MKSIILQTATRLLLPLLVLYSVFLLLEGHYNPGGGFVGGLVVSAAVGLTALAFDVPTARRVLPMSPHTLIGVGLLLALGSGVWSLAWKKPLLTGLWTTLSTPGGGNLELGTPLLFDVGVYLVVIGVATMVLLALAEA